MWPLSDDELRDVIAHLPAVIYQESHEPEPRTIFLSPNAETVLGGGGDEHQRHPNMWRRSIHREDHDRLMATWTGSYEAELPYTVDYRYHRPDGRIVWLREHAAPVRGAHGSVTHWQGVLLDVTAERAVEDELAASEARHRALVEHLPAAVYTLTNDDPPRLVFASDRIEELYGYPASRWIELDDLWPDVVHADDRDAVLRAWTDAYRQGSPFERRYRIVHAEGGIRWIHDRLHPVVDPSGSIMFWEGLSFDVTSEYETSQALRESEDRHERLLRQLPAAAFSLTTGPGGGFEYISPRIEDILGHPGSRWIDERGWWLRVVHPDDRSRVAAGWTRSERAGEPFRAEYRALHAQGRVVWIRAETLPVRDADGRVERWQGVWLDITETQMAREAQARTEARYQRLLEDAPAIVFTVSSEGAVEYVGPQVEQILGFPPEAWDDDPHLWRILIHPDDRDRVTTAWQEAVNGERVFEAEYRLRRADGAYLWVREHTHPVRDDEGRVRSWQGLTIDITRLRHAEQAQRAAEARARALVENIPAVVYEMGPDDERRTLYASHHVEELLGYTREEWLDQPDIWTELLHPDDRETELDAHDRHSATGEPWSREYRLIAADGRVVWVRDQATLVRDAEGRPTWQGVLFDITAQKDAEELLRLTNEELERRVYERTAALEEANALMGLEVAERRRAEKDLRRAETRFRQLVEQSPALVYAWQTHPGPDDEFRGYVSPQIERILGYTPQEWHNEWHVWDSRLHPHDHDRIVAAAIHSEETGEPFEEEYRYLAKDGRIVWVFDRATLLERDLDGRPFMFQGVMVDITVQKTAEGKAAEAEERFREIAEDGPYVAYAYSVEAIDPPTLTVEYVSPQIADLTGYPISRWIDDPLLWLEMIHPDDVARVLAENTAHWSTGMPWMIDYRMIAADGRILWLRDRGRCVERNEEGRPSRFLGALVDATDLVEDHERTLEKAATFRAVIDQIPAITWIETVDADAEDPRYLYISAQVEQVLGYTADELLVERTHFPRMIHPDDVERVDRTWREACLGGKERWEDRWRARHRNGTYRWIQARARRVSELDADPMVWVGISFDVTDAMVTEQVSAELDATRD